MKINSPDCENRGKKFYENNLKRSSHDDDSILFCDCFGYLDYDEECCDQCCYSCRKFQKFYNQNKNSSLKDFVENIFNDKVIVSKELLEISKINPKISIGKIGQVNLNRIIDFYRRRLEDF